MRRVLTPLALPLSLLLAGPAGAQDLPDPAAFEFVAGVEPLGQGDDRVSTRMEAALTAMADAFGQCRLDALDRGTEPYRYMQLKVKMRAGQGTVRKAKVSSSTSDKATDACVVGVMEDLVVDPPGMFDDKHMVNLTWKVPEPPDDASDEPSSDGE